MTISMAGLPAFLLYFVVGTALIVGFAAIYWKVTAHDELALIRAGNPSAAVAFGGSLLGFSIPLEKAIEQAASIPDLVIWAVIAMAVQFAAYALVRWLVPDLSRKIEENHLPAAGFLAVVSFICGTLAAASMTE